MPFTDPARANALAAIERTRRRVLAEVNASGCGTCSTTGRILNPVTGVPEKCPECNGQGVR